MVHVAVLGAGGGIGQPCSLLLALNLPPKSTLSLYDLAGVEGVAADISHIDTDVTIRWAQGALPPVKNDPELKKLAEGVDVFLVVAGVPRKPGMTRNDLLGVNAGIAADLASTCASVSPNAFFCIVTNPVNSVVPIVAMALKKLGVYNKNKLLGVSNLDVVRATRFMNDERNPLRCSGPVPVVGGHSGVTIVPLFSQVPGQQLTEDKARAAQIVHRVQFAGDEVVKAKKGKGSATLSMAYAGAMFTLKVVDGFKGNSNPLVYSYVDTDGKEDVQFLAIPVLLGKTGIVKRYPIGKMSETEKTLYTEAKAALKNDIKSAEDYVKSKL